MKLLKKLLIGMLVICLSVTMLPINHEYGTQTVQAASNVKLNKTKVKLVPGQKLKLKMSGTKATIKWSSSKKSVATVNSKGQVTAKKKGNCVIVAKIGKKQYKCKVTVVNLSAFGLNKKTLSLEEDDVYKLKIKYKPSSVKLTGKDVKWTSSDKDVAEVDEEGYVYAYEEGTAVITAKIGDKKAKCNITVKEPTVDVESISLSDDYLELVTGEEKTLGVTIYPSDAANQNVTWSSTNENIATVDANGKVKAISVGEAYIVAKVADEEEKCHVYVRDACNTSLSASCGDFVSIKKGDSVTIDITTDKGCGVTYAIEGENIILPKWEGWIGGNVARLTVSASGAGTTKLKIYDTYNPSLYIVITVKVTDLVNIEVPSVPQSISYRSSYNNRIYSSCDVTDIRCKVIENYDKTSYTVKVYFSGKKTYDYQGTGQSSSCKIGWKLYDEGGNVVESGTCFTPSVAVGEGFVDAYSIISTSLKPGDYTLKIMDVN